MSTRVAPPVAPRPPKHKINAAKQHQQQKQFQEREPIEGEGEEAYESIRQIDTSTKKVLVYFAEKNQVNTNKVNESYTCTVTSHVNVCVMHVQHSMICTYNQCTFY